MLAHANIDNNIFKSSSGKTNKQILKIKKNIELKEKRLKVERRILKFFICDHIKKFYVYIILFL